MQDAQARQGFALEQMSKAATDIGEATMAMPGVCICVNAATLFLLMWLA